MCRLTTVSNSSTGLRIRGPERRPGPGKLGSMKRTKRGCEGAWEWAGESERGRNGCGREREREREMESKTGQDSREKRE